MSDIIDSVGAITRAVAALGTTYTPGGYCLGHNAAWQLNGQTSTFGKAGRVAQYAIDAWNWSEHKVSDGSTPYHGAPVFFGVSPTRTDRNAGAGDVCTYHATVDKVVATDAYGNVVGLMTIAERAAQTQRPYLGYTLDFLGTLTSGGQKAIPASAAPLQAAPSVVAMLALVGGIVFPFQIGKSYALFNTQTGKFEASDNDITTLAAVKFGVPRRTLSAAQQKQIAATGFGLPFLLRSNDGTQQQWVLYNPQTGKHVGVSHDVIVLYSTKFGLSPRSITQGQLASYAAVAA